MLIHFININVEIICCIAEREYSYNFDKAKIDISIKENFRNKVIHKKKVVT